MEVVSSPCHDAATVGLQLHNFLLLLLYHYYYYYYYYFYYYYYYFFLLSRNLQGTVSQELIASRDAINNSVAE